MIPGRNGNKVVTNEFGTGLTGSATTIIPSITPHTVSVSTPGAIGYTGEDESVNTLTGPGDGQFATGAGSGAEATKRHGWHSQFGDSIEVDAAGGGRLVMQHRSGAAIVIEPDGSVFLTSESARGVGISAPFGDAFISSGGKLVLNAADINIVSRGNLTLSVGGDLTIRSKSYTLITNNMDETIDGSSQRSVTQDQATVVGGIVRETVAGDKRTQITGDQVTDVAGDDLHRVTGDQATAVGGGMTHAAKGAATYHSDGKATIDGDASVQLVGSTFVTGPLMVTQSIDAGTTIKGVGVVGSNVELKAPVFTNASVGASAPSAEEGYSGEIEKADVMDAEDIVDELTSKRKYPEYPNNGKLQAASGGSVSIVSHDETPQAQEVYDEYSMANQGNLNPATPENTAGTVQPNTEGNDSVAVDSPYDIPSSKYDKTAKISKYFTLGELIDAPHSDEIPQDRFEEVVKQHTRAAVNVLDAIKEKYPSLIITSAYRNSRPNHITGRAIDMVVQSRDLAVHADIAIFAAANLPCDQVFLERNTSGRTHVHIRVADSGKGATILTCGDPKCTRGNRTTGIDIEYLRRKGVKG